MITRGMIFQLILLSASCCLLTQAKDDLDDVQNLLKRNEKKKAQTLLLRLVKSKDDTVAVKAVLLLPMTEFPDDKMATLLKPYSDFSKANLSFPRVECFAEYCRRTAKKDGAKALQYLMKAREECGKGLPVPLVLESTGDCLLLSRKAEQALKHFNTAIVSGDAYFKRKKVDPESVSSELEPPKPNAGEWKRIKKRIQAKIVRAKRMLRINTYGEGFVLFEEARKAQMDEDYTKALATFAQILAKEPLADSVFGEAAKFYQCLCFPEEPEKAIKMLSDFYKSNPAGLWRGEALLEQGNLILTSTWTIKKPETLYEQAIEWCQKARKTSSAEKLYTLPQKAKTIAVPPDEYRSMDGFGIIENVNLEPGKVCNRLTTKWYLNEIEKQSRYGLIFTQFVQGKWDVMPILRPVLELDPYLAKAEELGVASTYLRYKNCSEWKKVVGEEVLYRKLSTTEKSQIFFGQFIYLQRRFKESKQFFQELLVRNKNTRNNDLKAAILMGIASAEHADSPEKQTKKQFQQRLWKVVKLRNEAIKVNPSKVVQAKCHLDIAATLSQIDVDVNLRKIFSHLELAAKLGKGTPYEIRALGDLVSNGVFSKNEAIVKKHEPRLLELAPEYRDRIAHYRKQVARRDRIRREDEELRKQRQREEDLKK